MAEEDSAPILVGVIPGGQHSLSADAEQAAAVYISCCCYVPNHS